jgi:chemotaxis protein CheZ
MECLTAFATKPGNRTMANPLAHDDGNDSADLQALFDSIAAGAAPVPEPVPPRPPAPAPTAMQSDSGDSDELQALFDSVSQAQAPATAVPPAPTFETTPPDAVFNGIGQLARQLHDSLRGLGMDRLLEDSARQIPDARERLSYIAQMTEQAASRVLNATDIARPLQDDLLARSQALGERWERMFANQLSVDEFKALAADSRGYFALAPGQLRLTNEQLMEIMMAQDFQDLTGQVIKKVVEMVQGLETQLLGLLLQAMPPERKAEAPEGLLNGPVIRAEGRVDVVSNQAQVDDLLESLGF